MQNIFERPVRRGAYAIPVIAEGLDKGKILFKTSAPENKGKSESGNLKLSPESQNIDQILSTLILAQQMQRLNGGMWELISGAVKNGETEKQAMIREIAEETGIEITADRLHSLETISPQDESWLASILVQQIKRGQSFSIEAVGFALALYETDLATFTDKKPEASYQLVSLEEVIEFVYRGMLDKTLRPSSALMVIDWFANSNKQNIVNSILESIEVDSLQELELAGAAD